MQGERGGNSMIIRKRFQRTARAGRRRGLSVGLGRLRRRRRFGRRLDRGDGTGADRRRRIRRPRRRRRATPADRRADLGRLRRRRPRRRMARRQRSEHAGDVQRRERLRSQVRTGHQPRPEVADRCVHVVRRRRRRRDPAVGHGRRRLGGLAEAGAGSRDPGHPDRPWHRARRHEPVRHPHRARQLRGQQERRRMGRRARCPTAGTTSCSKVPPASASSTSATTAGTR